MSEDLVDRNRFLEDIIQSLPGGVFQFHTDDDGSMCFRYRSSRAFQLAYLPPDWQLGINVHPEDRDRLIESVKEAVRTVSPWKFEGRCITASEEVRWVEGVALPTRKENGIVFNGLLLDITERKRAEETFQQSEDRYRRIVETCQEGVWLIDADTVTTYVNQRMADMLGYTREEMLSRSPLDFVDERYLERARSGLGRRKLGIRGQGEMCYRRKDGSELWTIISSSPFMDDKGKFIGALGIIADITDRKRIEESLRESEERFGNAFECAAIGMTLTSLSGRYFKVNRSMCELLGYSEGELLEKTFQDITYPDDLDADLAYVDQMLAGVISSYQMEKRYFHKSGAVIRVILTVSMVRDNLGKPLYFISQVQDITERTRVEEEKQRFYWDTIKSVTQGKLDLVSFEEVKEYLDSAEVIIDIASNADTVDVRHAIREFCGLRGSGSGKWELFEIAAGEAMGNAIKHAEKGRVYAGANRKVIWVAVSDDGPGIPALTLPGATLRTGFSTKISMGMGYSIMLEASDNILLSTGPQGTTVMLLKDIAVSEQALSLDDLPDTWDQ